jgi:hypothetical protein
MRFWLSGEVMADVADSHREARREVEEELNRGFSSRDYGPSLQELAFIAIILPPAEDAYPEIYKYDKRNRTVEARLKVSHLDFQWAPDKESRKRLLLDAIERAISRIEELKIHVDHERLLADFRASRKA